MMGVSTVIKAVLIAANIYFAAKVVYVVGRGAMLCDFAADLGASKIAKGEFCTTGLVGFARSVQ